LLFWLVVIAGAASFAGCFGLMAAIIVGSRGDCSRNSPIARFFRLKTSQLGRASRLFCRFSSSGRAIVCPCREERGAESASSAGDARRLAHRRAKQVIGRDKRGPRKGKSLSRITGPFEVGSGPIEGVGCPSRRSDDRPLL